MSAALIDGRMVSNLPVAPRAENRSHTGRVRARTKARNAADRQAVKRLKLMHLSEYQTLLAEEMRLAGQTPPKARPLDVYLRQLLSRRLLALTQRTHDDG